MKIILLSIFFLFPTINFAQEKQSLDFDRQIVYKLTYQPDSTDHEDIREEYMELLTNDSISLFESLTKGKLDSVEYEKMMSKNSLPENVSYSPFHYQIIKQNDEITTFDVFDNEPFYNGPNNFYYSESKDSFKWELTEDTLRINNLLCQKAEVNFGGRRWIAWFAVDIPILDGPYKFCGLPGLIVKIHDSNDHWQFEMVQFNTISKAVVINFKNDKQPEPTSKAEFFKNKHHYSKNSLRIREMYGFTPTDNESRLMFQKVSDEHHQRNNNGIELYP